jgi:putative phage-type endonuclease
MRTKEWLLERKKTLNGSEVAAVLGLSKWATPADIQREKLSEAINEEVSEPQRLGMILQNVIGREAAERRGLLLLEDEVAKKHEDWLSATIDYLAKDRETGEPVILECKATRDQSWAYIPTWYQIQLACQCHCHGIDRAILAALHASTKLETYSFRLSECNWWPEVLEKAKNWWHEHIVLGVPVGEPDVPVIPPVPGKCVNFGDDEALLVAGYLGFVAQAKELTDKAETVKKQIQGLLGDAEIGLFDNQPLVTWKSSTSERFDSTGFKKANPAEYAKYTKTSTSRRFLVKGGSDAN